MEYVHLASSVVSLLVSLAVLVLVVKVKKQKATACTCDTTEIENKIAELTKEYLALKEKVQKEMAFHIQEMMGRIDQLNDAVFNKPKK